MRSPFYKEIARYTIHFTDPYDSGRKVESILVRFMVNGFNRRKVILKYHDKPAFIIRMIEWGGGYQKVENHSFYRSAIVPFLDKTDTYNCSAEEVTLIFEALMYKRRLQEVPKVQSGGNVTNLFDRE